MKLRLHQFLSKTGLFKSKKDILTAIKRSEISIGGIIIKSPMYIFDKKKHRVLWKGKPIKTLGQKTYILINKPEGYLSSKLTNDDRRLKKKSIFELIKLDEKTKATLFCVGRLDEDTSGLLIITNDGDLGYKITNPKSNIEKEYEAILDRPLSREQTYRIEGGVVINLEENGKVYRYKTRSCKVRQQGNKVSIILTEGKKREARRIFETVGRKVVKLKRTRIGSILLDDLKEGEYKVVEKEVLDQFR